MREFWLFVAYSFLGFVIETAYTLLRTGRLANRKTMRFLPLCPVYGLGGVALVLMHERFPMPPLLFAVLGGLACTAIEYGYSLMCETVFRVRLWDYGTGRGVLHGRIHWIFCVYWGALSLALIAWVQPVMQRMATAIPAAWFPWAAALLAADAVATAALLYRFGHRGGRMPGCPVARRVI